MKKVLLTLLVAGATLTYSCNPKDNTKKDRDDDKEVVSDKGDKDDDEGNVEEKATAELCNCINNAMEDMSPKVRKILVKAGNSDDPEATLQSELTKISDREEQQKIGEEFQQLENNTQLQKCSDKIKKKYDLDDKDKKAQKKILKAAEENEDCEVVYALMKIGMQQEQKGKSSDDSQE